MRSRTSFAVRRLPLSGGAIGGRGGAREPALVGTGARLPTWLRLPPLAAPRRELLGATKEVLVTQGFLGLLQDFRRISVGFSWFPLDFWISLGFP